jgi:hypothetical protein
MGYHQKPINIRIKLRKNKMVSLLNKYHENANRDFNDSTTMPEPLACWFRHFYVVYTSFANAWRRSLSRMR